LAIDWVADWRLTDLWIGEWPSGQPDGDHNFQSVTGRPSIINPVNHQSRQSSIPLIINPVKHQSAIVNP
jgi:hypothetical protein